VYDYSAFHSGNFMGKVRVAMSGVQALHRTRVTIPLAEAPQGELSISYLYLPMDKATPTKSRHSKSGDESREINNKSSNDSINRNRSNTNATNATTASTTSDTSKNTNNTNNTTTAPASPGKGRRGSVTGECSILIKDICVHNIFHAKAHDRTSFYGHKLHVRSVM
jgi:hypothetical protein